MNIAILSRGENLYSTQSLVRAGEARNHTMEVIDPAYCKLSIFEGKVLLQYQDEPLLDIDAVIPRVGSSTTNLGTSVVRHFEAMGVFCTVTSEAIWQSRNKWTCFQILAKASIALPNTVYGVAYDMEELLSSFQDFPVIIKLTQGTHGHGVILAETYQSALSTIETLSASNISFVIQEFIAESNGADLRAIVVDGVVVAAMKRQSKAGDFRSNLHRGGSSEAIILTHEEERLAIRTAKVLRLGVCGVDILQSNRGPLVLEVNSTPGLEGIETTTGKNISKSIIGYIERNRR